MGWVGVGEGMGGAGYPWSTYKCFPISGYKDIDF